MDEPRDRVRAVSAALRAHLQEELDLGEQGIALAREATAKEGPDTGRPTRPRRKSGTVVAGKGAAEPSPEPGPAPGSDEKRFRLQELGREAASCTACELHLGRTHSVFGGGDSDARLVFVGEGPGYEEDQQGEPFVGQAGQLLDRMIAAMGFARDRVYICNVVKCRPPENRTPRPEEAEACRRFLRAQLELVAPEVIVALGRCAAENLGVAPPSGRWRGTWKQWQGIPVMPTYHPAYLLRTPSAKRPVWEDLQKVMKKLGMASR
jgi:uracil-DNA glycosylase family 4